MAGGDYMHPSPSKPFDEMPPQIISSTTTSGTEHCEPPHPYIQKVAWTDGNKDVANIKNIFNPSQNLINPELVELDLTQQNLTSSAEYRKVLQVIPPSDPMADKKKEFKLMEDSKKGGSGPSTDVNLAVDDLNIPWCELALKERIGAGK